MTQLAVSLPHNIFSSEILIINRYYDYEMLKILERDNIKYYLLNRFPSTNAIYSFIYLWKTIKILNQNKYDIVHCHSVGSAIWIVIAKLLSSCKCSIVLTLHSIKLLKQNKCHGFLTLFINRIIAISKAVLLDIEKINQKKGLLIYNGIPLYKFSPKSLSFRNPVLIGNVARLLVTKKGQDTLIYAVADLIKRGFNIICWIIGEDMSSGVETINLKELAKQLNIEDHIIFKGKQDDINTVLNSVDIFVLPSRIEGFGLVLVEAMAKGIPVIASDLDGPKEIISHGENGLLFPVDDVNKLSECISRLLVDQEYAKYLAQNAMKRAQEFSLTKMLNHHKELYLELYGQSKY